MTMVVAANQVFERIANETFTWKQLVFENNRYFQFRKRARELGQKIGTESECVKSLRSILWEADRNPVCFDKLAQDFADWVESNNIKRLYGHLFDPPPDVLAMPTLGRNPLRDKAKEEIENLVSEERVFRIYCASIKWRAYYEELLPEAVDRDRVFLKGRSRYKDTECCDVLIHVGPFSDKHWSSPPSALFNAPRFSEVLQFLWRGYTNEDDFGTDIIPSQIRGDKGYVSSISMPEPIVERIHDTTLREEDTIGGIDIEDITAYFSDPPRYHHNSTDSMARCAMIQIPENQGVLYRCNSERPVLRKRQDDWSIEKLPAAQITEGDFIVLYPDSRIELELQGDFRDTYSETWKKELYKKSSSTPACMELINELQQSGISIDLNSAIPRWIEPAGNLNSIPGPGSQKDFVILMKVLELTDDVRPQNLPSRPFYDYAWAEIQSSRGKAIQAGRELQDSIDERYLDILRTYQEDLQDKAYANQIFEFEIPKNIADENNDESLNGVFSFYRVLDIEDGYSAPDVEVEKIQPLKELDKWRG